MARLARCYSSSDDELPELDTLLRKTGTKASRGSKPVIKLPVKSLVPKATTTSSTRRVRRLAEPDQVNGNPLFQKWDASKEEEVSKSRSRVKVDETRVTVKEIKKVTKTSVATKSVFEDEKHATQKEAARTQRNRPRVVDELREDSDDASESEDENLFARIQRLKTARSKTTNPISGNGRPAFSQPKVEKPATTRQRTPVYDIESESDGGREKSRNEDDSFYLTAEEEESSSDSEDAASEFGSDPSDQLRKELPSKLLFNRPQLEPKTSTSATKNAPKSTASELAETFSKLRLQLDEFSEDEKTPKQDRFTTPPSTPPKPIQPKGLTSPTKKIQIPKTPHRPSTDAFWSQDIVNDWNEQHSPRKLVLSPAKKSPVKTSPKKETKKAFGARKHAIAEDFLRELDQEITQGRIAELAESTGGVKIVWSKTLNTTAGRANWKRETLRTKQADGTQVSVTYKHHASIELAEKVIDDEHRLLNVLAHEFCHLANFMITGITTNPHGKEFKAWASRVSLAFSSRDITVTTKHSYEIDFKYVWTCTACCAQYKRHSKSIDPQRHRCGTCKSELKQTKPVPRGGGKVTRYQAFVKEQMTIVREENPGSPQKDVMRLIANKWTKEGGGKKDGVDGIVGKIVDLTLEE